MPFRFDHPDYLWLLLLALPVIALGMRSLAAIERSRRWTAIGLRLALLLVLILMLAGFQAVRWHHDLTVVAVLDESESVRRFALPTVTPAPGTEAQSIGDRVREWVAANAAERRADDRLGLVTFDARPTVRVMPGPDLDLTGATLEQPVDGSDAATAVRMGMAVFPADTSRRMLLVSDGNETTGRPDDLLAAAREAAAAGVAIDVLPIEYSVKNEVMVDGLYVPADAREGQAVAIRIVLRATAPAAGTIRLLLDGDEIKLPPEATRVNPADWTDGSLLVRRVQAPPLKSGANRFEVVFEPDAGNDAIPANNRAQSFTLVQGKGRVLIVDGVGGDSGAILAKALAARGIETQTVERRDTPLSITEMQRHDAIILQNIPAEEVSPAQQKMMETYVTEMGGGLVVIGGPDSFGAGGWANTPVDRILPVNCELPKQTKLPVGALVMVIDESGSMMAPMGNSPLFKQQVANQSAVLAAHTLFPNDLLGVLAFSNDGRWVRPIEPYTDPKPTDDLIQAIGGGGGTNIYGPLVQAYDALANIYDRNVLVKHIIMLTDGQGDGGDYDELLKKMRQASITLTTVGVGDSVDATLLKRLATDAGGKFHHVKDPKDLPQIFIKEARQVRKQLIREKPFQPTVLPTSSPIMAGVAYVPPLQGMVLTGPKTDPRIFMPIVGAEGEPIFAHWQVGLGRTAAYTSDAHNRWAVDWLAWDGYADFWTRTLRNIARPAVNRDFDLAVAVDRDTLRIRLDTGSAGKEAKVAGSILMPDGQARAVTLEPVAPGIFEATAPADAQGSYIVSLFAQQGDDRGYVFGGSTRQAGEELRKFTSNRDVLEQVAQITGGRVFDFDKIDPATLFQRDDSLTRSRSIRPMWRGLLGLALILFMLDVAARRVAWDFGAMIQWYRHARQRAHARNADARATLQSLRTKPAPAEKPPPAPPPAGFPPPMPTQATPREERARPVQASTPTTNRLLDAKRRTQQRLSDKDPGPPGSSPG